MVDEQKPRSETESGPAAVDTDDQVSARDRVRQLADRARAGRYAEIIDRNDDLGIRTTVQSTRV